MKQKLTALLLVLLLAVTLVLPVMAAAPYVDDEAAILTLSEVETLEARAAEISEHYGVGVYICILDDFGDYGYPDAATASYSIYHAQSLGYGSGRRPGRGCRQRTRRIYRPDNPAGTPWKTAASAHSQTVRWSPCGRRASWRMRPPGSSQTRSTRRGIRRSAWSR